MKLDQNWAETGSPPSVFLQEICDFLKDCFNESHLFKQMVYGMLWPTVHGESHKPQEITGQLLLKSMSVARIKQLFIQAQGVGIVVTHNTSEQ